MKSQEVPYEVPRITLRCLAMELRFAGWTKLRPNVLLRIWHADRGAGRRWLTSFAPVNPGQVSTPPTAWAAAALTACLLLHGRLQLPCNLLFHGLLLDGRVQLPRGLPLHDLLLHARLLVQLHALRVSWRVLDAS